jgi:hypothetical protein
VAFREPKTCPIRFQTTTFSHRDAGAPWQLSDDRARPLIDVPFPNMDLSEIPASLWYLANRLNYASGALRRRQLHIVARRLVALKAVKSCYMRVAPISSVPQSRVLILTGHPLGHEEEKEDSACRLVPTPKYSRALASTLPAAPASFAQVYPQVVCRERVPVTTVVWNLGGGYLAAAASARELNHGRAIGRKHAPATTFCGAEGAANNPAMPAEPVSNVVLRTRLELAPTLSQWSDTQPVRMHIRADSA